MTKETLLKNIHEAFGENKTNLSERTLDDYVSNIMLPRVPEDKEAFEQFMADHVNVIKSINGQVLHEVKKGVLEGLSKVDKKDSTPKEETEPVVEEGKTGGDESKVLGAVDAKIAELESMIQKMAAITKEKEDKEKVNSLISEARKTMESKNASHAFTLNQTQRLINVTPDMEVDDVVSAWENEYNAFYKELNSSGTTPLQGGGDFSQKAASKALSDFKAELESRGKIPKTE